MGNETVVKPMTPGTYSLPALGCGPDEWQGQRFLLDHIRA